jgi:glycosyltransferase involved in cell wall biosynthesis
MNILFLGTLPHPITGQSLACQVFLDELNKHHRVDVVNLSKRGFRHGVDSAGRVVGVLRIVVAVWRRRNAAEVIYLTVSESFAGNMKDLLIYLVCFRRLSRMVIHLHGGAGLRGIMLGRRGLHRRANEFFLRRLGGAIVLGQRHADVFAQTLPGERIYIVPNFAQDYLFSDATSGERKFGDTAPLRILYLSNLIPGKGYLELLDAFSALDEHVRARVTIDFAGDFESDEHRRKFLSRIEDMKQVRYHGVVGGERKKALFHMAHVFCLPTYFLYEGQPISILEAYASGCAVITTDHSGIGDVFADGVNGYQVAKRSPSSIKIAIERALSEPDHLRAMALDNLSAARLNYRTEKYNSHLMGILEAVGARS